MESVTPSTAETPSNARRRSRVSRMSPAPGCSSTTAPSAVVTLGMIHRRQVGLSGLRGRAPPGPAAPLGEDALRPEPEKRQDEQPDHHPLHGGNEVGRPDRRDEPRDLQEAERYEHGAQRRPEVIAAPADNEGGEQHDRL